MTRALIPSLLPGTAILAQARAWMIRAFSIALGIATTRPVVGAFFCRQTPGATGVFRRCFLVGIRQHATGCRGMNPLHGARGTRLALLVLTLTISLRAQKQEIAVELKDVGIVPSDILMQAQLTASRIYAGIDVKLKWSMGGATDISVQFDTATAEAFHSEAMGYAAPYGSKTVVHVLVDRVSHISSIGQTGVLLGHIIAHELGHILKGTNGHADWGIMKAEWDTKDLARMTFRQLSFTPLDAELIQEGVRALTTTRLRIGQVASRRP
jgi:hypothetical protein